MGLYVCGMHVHVSVYMCVCVCVFVHALMHTGVYVCVCVCMHIVGMCIDVCLCTGWRPKSGISISLQLYTRQSLTLNSED